MAFTMMTTTVSLQASESALEKLREGTATADELLNLLKQYNLMPLLLRELLIDDAIASIPLSDQEHLNVCSQFDQQQHLTTDVDRQTWLETHQLSQPQLDRLITRSVRLAKFKQATWGHKLASYFLQRKPQLDRVIMISTPSPSGEGSGMRRYCMGQLIVTRAKMSAQVAILYEGQARSLRYEPDAPLPITLERLQPGAIIGWVGLVRGVACETAIASARVEQSHSLSKGLKQFAVR